LKTSLIFLLAGVILVAFSPLTYIWSVQVQSQDYRETQKYGSADVRPNTNYDLNLNPSVFGVNPNAGESLVVIYSASASTGVIVNYQNSGHTIVILYPPTGLGFVSGTMVLSNEPNTPDTITLNEPGPVTVRFTNSQSNSELYVTYHVFVSYPVTHTDYPYRDSATYLAGVGIALTVVGAYFSKRTGRPPAARKRGKRERKPVKAFCINCGSKLLPDSRFCNKCGTEQ